MPCPVFGVHYNPNVLLGVARVNQEMGRYEVAQKTYRKLEDADPGLAKKFAYLNLPGSESSRAADASGMKEKVLWQDE